MQIALRRATGRCCLLPHCLPAASARRAVHDDPGLATQFSELTNLADAQLGARVIFATDEWFAVGSCLLKPNEPEFDPNAFCEQGKVMDGWESRRRRTAGFDWCVVRLGLAGHVQGIEIDTAWFTGK